NSLTYCWPSLSLLPLSCFCLPQASPVVSDDYAIRPSNRLMHRAEFVRRSLLHHQKMKLVIYPAVWQAWSTDWDNTIIIWKTCLHGCHMSCERRLPWFGLRWTTFLCPALIMMNSAISSGRRKGFEDWG